MSQGKRADRFEEHIRKYRAQRSGKKAGACAESECRGNHDQEEEKERFTWHVPLNRQLKQKRQYQR
jgi:hypothetical protein